MDVSSEVMTKQSTRVRILINLYTRWRTLEPPPTYRQLAEELGVSLGAVQHHIREMRTENLVHEDALWLTSHGHMAYTQEAFGKM